MERRRLVLDAKVAAARFLAVERILAEQLGKLQEVGHAAGLLERLVELFTMAQHGHILPERLPDAGNLRQRAGQTLAASLHAALIPHELAQLPVELIDGPFTPHAQHPPGTLLPLPCRRRKSWVQCAAVRSCTPG